MSEELRQLTPPLHVTPPEGEENDDKVLVDRKQLDEILTRLQRVERGDAPMIEEAREHTVRMRKVDNKYVVGIARKPYEKLDPKRNEDILYMDVYLYEGADAKPSKKTVEYTKFIAEAIEVECKILDTDIKVNEKVYGHVIKTKVDGFKTISQGVKVPVKTVTPERFYVIELPEGDKLKIHEKFVNM